jgi:Methyltransferase domain
MVKQALKKILVSLVKEIPPLENRLRWLIKEVHPGTTILLDYPVNLRPRYGHGNPPHQKLYEVINKNRALYRKHLESALRYRDHFLRIPMLGCRQRPIQPTWINGFLPSLDAVALYSFMSSLNPRRYYEIGSGNSTKFARQAIQDHSLRTRITSIDPHPRVGIDAICDHLVREPVEDVDLGRFDELEEGDILFVDSSHRAFTNSDVTVIFLDILPKLKPGVLVEFHDIHIPLDYHARYGERYFNEQYLLAVYLLAETNKFLTILPNTFVMNDEELNGIVNPLFDELELSGGQKLGRHRNGVSFWIKMT